MDQIGDYSSRKNTNNASLISRNSSLSGNLRSVLLDSPHSLDNESTHERSRHRLFDTSPPKYDQHTYSDKYASHSNKNYIPYAYDQYTPYDHQDSNDEDIEAIKQEMRFIKQDSLSSTRNAVRTAIQAEETGRQTLAKLGVQSERIGNTEKHLDLTAVNTKIAEEKNKALNHLNRSVFIPHFKKPWKKQSRLKEKEQHIRNQYELEQMERERTRRSDYESVRRIKDALHKKERPLEKQPLNDRLRYRFEPDEEDDEIENELDQNLAQLDNITAQLKAIATATQEEIISQNNRLDRISEKGYKLNAEIYVNAERLKRIN